MKVSFKTLFAYASLAASILALSGCQNNSGKPVPNQKQPSDNLYPDSAVYTETPLSPVTTSNDTTSDTIISDGETSAIIASTSETSQTISDSTSTDSSDSDISKPENSNISKPENISEPETKELTAADVLEQLSTKLNNTVGFNLTGTVKGELPVEISSNSSGSKVNIQNKMLRHTFTYSVSQNGEHFVSQTEDLNDATFESKYEEYRHLDDEIITTYTLNNNTWVDSTPKELSRKNLAQTLADDFGLIAIFKNPAAFKNPELKLLDNGYQINTKWSDLSLTEPEMKMLLNKLIRCNNLKIRLDSINPLTCDQMLTVTMDKDYNPTGISCDIITDNCDTRINLLITDYGKPLNITMPNE